MYTVPKVSRFSWTNSQAAPTPHDPHFSINTNRSSIPRFRTVESWVGQQAQRIENADTGKDGSGQDRLDRGMSMFPVPDVPREYVNEPSAPPPLRVSRKKKSSDAPVRASMVTTNMIINRTDAEAGDEVGEIPRMPDASSSAKTIARASKMSGNIMDINTDDEGPVIRKSSKRIREKRSSDSTVFRYHPGTRVDLPPTGRVPSAVLDENLMPVRL
jgi:hypothetical protein